MADLKKLEEEFARLLERDRAAEEARREIAEVSK